MSDQSKSDVVALPAPTCMESFNRVAKLPVIESTVNTVTTVYEKVKDYNSLTQMAFTTAESAMEKVVEVGKPIATPIVQSLEGPIKKVDGILCSGLDYVESKVPAVKLPPSEMIYQMYSTTKDYVQDTVGKTYNIIEPAVKSAYGKVEPIVKGAYEKVEPAVEQAKHALEPTYEKAKDLVEPYVQPAFERVEQYFHKCANKHAEGQETCDECKPPQKDNEEKAEESQ